jgi:hypothetical protein
MGNILEGECAEFAKHEVEPAVHVVAHGTRDTDPTRRTFGLEPGRHVYTVAMKIGTVSDYVANVDANSKPDHAITRLIAIRIRHLLLYLDRAARCPVDAVEDDEQRVAPGLNDPAAMLVDRWIDQCTAEASKPFERSQIIQTDETAVADHVGIDDGDQLPPPWRPADQI